MSGTRSKVPSTLRQYVLEDLLLSEPRTSSMNTHRGVAPGGALIARGILGDGMKPGQDLAPEKFGYRAKRCQIVAVSADQSRQQTRCLRIPESRSFQILRG